MSLTLRRPARMVAVTLLATPVLLGALARPGRAEKSTDCRNQTTSLCQTVERCSGGFEANGSCQWIYTISYYYWKY